MKVEITKAGKKRKDRRVVNDDLFQEVVEMMIRHPNLWSLVYALFEHWDNKPREANRKDFFLCLRGPEASGRVASGEDTNGALERAVCAFGNLNES